MSPPLRLLCLIAFSATLLPLAAACDKDSGTSGGGGGGPQSTGGDGGKALTIGFSQIGAESGWRTAETKSIQAEAVKRGVNLKFSDAQQKQENQIKAVRSFVSQKVDAIILAPVVETGWEPVLKEAKRANIPVILVDRGVSVSDDSLYTTLIASDFVEEGRMAGNWLAEKLGGKGNVVELQGTTGSAPANDRKKGFEEAIAKHPDLKIIKSQSGDFTKIGGKQVMEAFLKAAQGEGTKIDAVYAHNDDMALGAIQAIKEVGRKPGKDIVIVSVDAMPAALEAIVKGELNAAVECDPILGPRAFDAAEKAVKGEALPKKMVVQDRLFDSANAKVGLDEKLPFTTE